MDKAGVFTIYYLTLARLAPQSLFGLNFGGFRRSSVV